MDYNEEIWNDLEELKNYRSFDVNTEWESFLSLVETEKTSEDLHTQTLFEQKKKQSKRFRMWSVVSVAASMVFLVSAYFLWIYDSNPMITTRTLAEAMDINLSDGSTVQLNPHSSLFYPKTFEEGKDRIVSITGNAVFHISDLDGQSFIAETDHTAIRVLGTIFSIEMQDGSTTVENIEGKILFYEKSNEKNGIVLNPGDIINHSEEGFKDISVVIDNTPEHQVQNVLEYLTTTFKDQLFLGMMFGSTSNYDPNAMVKVDLNQELLPILQQLDSTALFSFSKALCESCFQITKFQGKQD